jgi:hypothetical protein
MDPGHRSDAFPLRGLDEPDEAVEVGNVCYRNGLKALFSGETADFLGGAAPPQERVVGPEEQRDGTHILYISIVYQAPPRKG